MTMQVHSQAALIAIDWGSTNFRAFLLNNKGHILDQVNAPQGVLSLQGNEYETVLLGHIAHWLIEEKLPVVMAGMVGSIQGWKDAGYIKCEADIAQCANQLSRVDNDSQLNLSIVPGVKCHTVSGQPDVMRGEEVQVYGAIAYTEQQQEHLTHEKLSKLMFCLPGTHSKWVKAGKNKDGQSVICGLSTHMTGEMYNIVVDHSLLGKGLAHSDNTKNTDIDSFLLGIHTSQRKGGMLHHLFSARTLRLEQKLKPEHVTSYLSGLLIGAELAAVIETTNKLEHVYLIGNSILNDLYAKALSELGYLSTPICSAKASALGIINIAQKANLVSVEEVGSV